MSLKLLLTVAFYAMSLKAISANFYMQPVYSTKTAYRFLKDISKQITENDESITIYNGKTYRIVNLYLVLRHGSRSPFLSEIQAFNKLHKRLKENRRVVSKNPFIVKWDNPFPENLAYTQYEAGNEEQRVLAHRYGKMFNGLFDGNLNRIDYSVTPFNVTKQSFIAFYEELSALFKSNMPRPTPVTDMLKLRFYLLCKKLKKLRETKPYQYLEFLNGSKMRLVLEKVRRKLGTTDITTENVVLMSKTCAFELGVFNRSPWCYFFDIEDFRIIDYLLDMLLYWERSYGLSINRKLSCPLTSNLFQTFDYFIKNEEHQHRLNVAEIGFSHVAALLSAYTSFGILPEYPPLYASDYEFNRNRLFRAGKFGPMAANFAVGLYKCDGYYGDYVVKMFVNEEPITIPRCGRAVCPYRLFRRVYNNLTVCDFDGFCENNSK